MITELTPPKTSLAFRALSALRTNWTDEAETVRHIDEVMRPAGYRLVGAFGDEEYALAVVGFRTGHSLAWGHYIHVSDMSTLPEGRGQRLAPQLLEWVENEARRLGCDGLHVDSGVGPTRAAAHRTYMNAGYQVSMLHFVRPLS